MKNVNLFNVGFSSIVVAVMVMSAFGTLSFPDTAAAGEPQYLLAHFEQLPDENAQAAIRADGIEILNYQGDGNYLIRVSDSFPFLSALGGLADSIIPYPDTIKVSPELNEVAGMVPVRVTLHAGEDAAKVVATLESCGAVIEKVHDITSPYILCSIDAANIRPIASLNQVNSIHHNPAPQTHMSLISSNTYMGIDTPQSYGFSGSGMLAEVQDNGCDRTHPDLQNVDYTDGTVTSQDHGTCTTGIVFGTGAGDATAQGCAPQAVGVFADWYTGRTAAITNLWNGDFNEGMAGNNGVVQSNSWSQGTCNGYYTIYPAEDDTMAVNFPKVLQLWAAANSNDGTGEGMISQDSAAKNVICVGAIFHKNTAAMTDDQYLLQQAGNTPSRGPAADGRQKPDLCGCFDYIHTVDRVGSLGYTSTNYYDNFGGTSGATPEVAGSSLLAYEMYKENYFENNPTNAIPYSSTIKALMIADAFQYPLTGTYSATRTCQGWGTPDMEKMYNLGAVYHQFDEYPQAMSSGTTWTRQVYADAVNPLKITLCWTDPAAPGTTNTARALRNNLDLKVTSPGGVIYYGNNGLWDSLYSASGTVVNHWSTSSSYRDDLNNVENVFIQTPQTGIWTIEVSGRTGDIAQGPQHFSLVSSGARIPISSAGTIDIENDVYPREAVVTITVKDRDLNTNTGTAQTVNVNLKSGGEPAGETTLLTETGPDTSTFVGTKTISATNSAGVVYVLAADTLTATYNDANDGSGSPAVVTDTATVDGTAPTPPTGLTVQHYGYGTNPTATTLTTAGTTQAGGPHNVWFTIVDSNAGTELTTPNSVVEFSDTYYANAATSNDVRAGPSSTPGVGDYEFLKCQFATTVNPATVNNITLTFEGYFSAALTATMYAWNAVDSAWDNLGTAAISTTDTIMTKMITTDPGDYISGGYIMWGVWAGSARRSCTVDFLQVLINYEVPYTTLNDNTMNWTASVSGDVDHYNIYRATVSGGPYSLIGASPVGTNTYQDDGKGQGDSTYWWYRVRAVDAAGNEGVNTTPVQEPLPGAPYSISLAGKAANSWVFVSFPSMLSNNIQTVLNDAAAGDGLTTWSVAKWFDGTTKAWKSYRATGTQSFTTVNNQVGVWLYLTANSGDQKLTLSSYAANSSVAVNINLYLGWNMVGYPSATNRLGSATLPPQATAVSVWQVGTPYITDSTPGAVTMSAGNAYWVKVNADCVWTVNP
jgi:hypothetical protein